MFAFLIVVYTFQFSQYRYEKAYYVFYISIHGVKHLIINQISLMKKLEPKLRFSGFFQ